jgi:hypothetical protein
MPGAALRRYNTCKKLGGRHPAIEDSGPVAVRRLKCKVWIYEKLKRAAGMRRRVLSGGFVGNDPAQRSRARNWKLHMPEIGFG